MIRVVQVNGRVAVRRSQRDPRAKVGKIGPDARYRFMGDEHGAVIGSDLPGLGARITLGTPHCDPTVNLYDAYHVISGEVLTAIWPVTARGRSA